MASVHIGNSDLISRVNSRLVLQAVRKNQPTYRAEVARETMLKPATVTGIVNDLLSQDLLQEVPATTPATTTRGGRPPVMLQLNADARHILAIDLEPDCIRVALTDLLAQVVAYREQLIDRFSEPAMILRQMLALCDQVLGGREPADLQGVGLSLPGQIDRENGVLLSSTNMPKWRNVPIRDLLGRKLGVAPRIMRSVHLAALHEGWAAPDQQDQTTLLISLRTGIGMGLIHQGEVYTGVGGFDGEIGHTIVDLNGAECECGSRGCLETFVSASAICKRIEARLADGRCAVIKQAIAEGEPLRPELAYRFAKAGDPDCAEIVRDIGRHIGIAAANLINLLAPHRLVLCGAIDTADELILESLRRQIDQHALPKVRDRLRVGLARGKEKSPLLGAAVLVAQDLFELPKLRHGLPSVGADAEQALAGADRL